MDAQEKHDVIVVGAGVAGLSCACRLAQFGLPVHVIDRADAPGGRVRTDRHDGYRLDRGFQVFLDSYRQAGRIFPKDRLHLRRFRPGAAVAWDGHVYSLVDPWRCPGELASAWRFPLATWRDKWKVLQLRTLLSKACSDGVDGNNSVLPDISTDEFLREFGFSELFIKSFFQPFFSNIFLEPSLGTSARFFGFIFRMLSEGYATLPSLGMESLINELLEGARGIRITCNRQVREMLPDRVTFEDGQQLEAAQVVCAVDANNLPQTEIELAPCAWNGSTTFYFSGETPWPFGTQLLIAGGYPSYVVAPISMVAPAYAPPGRHLYAIATADPCTDETELQSRLLSHFQQFYPASATWSFLKSYQIARAVPHQPAPLQSIGALEIDGVFFAGDYLLHSSIEGAVTSGLRAAELVLARRR